MNRWLIGMRPQPLAVVLVPVVLGAAAAMVAAEPGDGVICRLALP